MIHLSHRTLIILSGLVWLAIGAWLLSLGLNFIQLASLGEGPIPLLSFLAPYMGSLENGAVALMALSLFVGYFKGRKVLGKSAQRGIDRILTLSNPAPLTQIYSPMYYLLLGSMVLLGLSIKWFGLSLDIRGAVDLAIGSALLNGSMTYFRHFTLNACS